MKSKGLFLGCVLLGCNGPSDASPPPSEQAASGGGVSNEGSSGEAALGPSTPAGALLPRGAGHDGSISEVFLDPRASAALSLDTQGGVRLWPALPPAQTSVAALAPIRVPILEPLSLSLARASEGEFVIAAIDTTQSARVISIELDAGGVARVRERFTLPPSDPLLELHVLDGGDRLLALGVDHGLRLHDGQGKLVAELAEYGLVPWQLRFAGPPESLKIAMILAGPTRVQRFTITDDHFARVGEPHAVVLDRGPNRNDLALLPSGRVAAVLRRPKSRTKQWSLELHDLDSGEVRVMWGEVESELRPRLYIVDDARALLEDGSGAGFWVDLNGGVAMPAPFELPKELEALPPEAHVSVRRVELPGSSKPTRRRTSVVAGVRVVPRSAALIVDPLDADRHHRVEQRALSVRDLTLDADGARLAMALNDGEIIVESLADDLTVIQGHAVVGCTSDSVNEIEFSDPDHLVLLGEQHAWICAWASGSVVSELELPPSYSGAIHLTEPGAGALAIVLQPDEDDDEEYDDEPPRRISSVSIAGNRFGALETVAKANHDSWPELDDSERSLALDRTGQRYTQPRVDTRKFNITPSAGKERSIKISDDKLDIDELVPSADGRRVAIVHAPASEYDDYEYEYSYYSYSAPRTLSVWSVAGEIPERLWSTPADGSMNLSWSADGSRLALEYGPGLRVVTDKGDTVYERRELELEVEERPDVPDGDAPPP